MRPWMLGWMLAGLIAFGFGCESSNPDDPDPSIEVVTTTNIVGDLVENVGGEHVRVQALMGPGVDPHLYRASEGDVSRMNNADIIIYNGLDLEGRMTNVLAQMKQQGRNTVALAEEAVSEDVLLESEEFEGNFDPHIWLDVQLWQQAAEHVADVLAEHDPEHADAYRANAETFTDTLGELDTYVRERADEVEDEQRVLITSHDAFRYFGRAYDFEVRGLQGISTDVEAGTADVRRLADFVAERRIPALFVETSVSQRGIEAVREAVRDRGFDVTIGGTLYGDALGSPGTDAGTYTGMVRHNVDTIVEGLSGEAGEAAEAPAE